MIPRTAFSYVKNGDQKLVLVIAQQFLPAKAPSTTPTPICLGSIMHIRVLEDIVATALLLN